MRLLAAVLLVLAACAHAQVLKPRFAARDLRPHGLSDPYPLRPKMLAWMFGSYFILGRSCSAAKADDPATYRTELCGTRVRVGGQDAQLIAVLPGQINLVLPDHPWMDEMVPVQVIRDGIASDVVPVHFGSVRPTLSLPEQAKAGMPIWVHVDKPYGRFRLRYPQYVQPWAAGPGSFEVVFQGKQLPPRVPVVAIGLGTGWMMGLPGEYPQRWQDRAPLHLLYAMDKPGVYRVRFRDFVMMGVPPDPYHIQESEWLRVEVLPTTESQRRVWMESLTLQNPEDVVELLSDYLPSVLAAKNEVALRKLRPYLWSKDMRVQYYARYALNYFDPVLRKRVVPDVEPMSGGVY